LPYFILSSNVYFTYLLDDRNNKLLFKNFDFFNRRK
jgi:hypothetical protein